MPPNTNYATLATTTLIHFANEIFDNVITNNAALNELKKAGNIKVVEGGRQFTHPVYYKANTTFGAIGKYGTISTDMQDPLTRAEYDIKVVAGSVVYSLVEEAMNAGNKEKLIDYVEALKMDAETSMAETLGDQIFMSEASASGSNFDSIPLIISSIATNTQSAVGNIAGSAYSWWRPYQYSATSVISSFNSTNLGLTAMDTTLNNTTFGRQGPTFIITTKSIFTLYMIELQANVRYSQLDRGEAGFRNLLYATLPVMADDNCPDDWMYFIDGKALKLQVLSQGNMKMTQFQQAYSQLMARSLLYVLANLTCGSRRTCGNINISG